MCNIAIEIKVYLVVAVNYISRWKGVAVLCRAMPQTSLLAPLPQLAVEPLKPFPITILSLCPLNNLRCPCHFDNCASGLYRNRSRESVVINNFFLRFEGWGPVDRYRYGELE